MRSTAAAAMVMAVVALTPACSSGRAVSDGEPQIRLNVTASGWRTVDVEGLPADDLEHLNNATLTAEEWTSILRVQVAAVNATAAELPAVLGETGVTDGVLRFTPRFPFDPGQRYDVVFDPKSLPSTRTTRADALPRLSATVEVPAPARAAPTRVVGVYPTATEVPENHLRWYIVFSAPMSFSGRASQIQLVDDRGEVVSDPFLPLDLALWNEDRTRYTVLYDPGRVKRGIRPNEEMGRALVEGRTYTLVVGADWLDASGQPLASGLRHEFRVGPPEERAIDPDDWRLELPAPGTRDRLAVSFTRPLDFGLLHRALVVMSENGAPVAGDVQVEQTETHWLFTPDSPWSPGAYQLVASSALEDVAGNRIGRPFEVATAAGQALSRATGARVPFVIPAAASQ